MIWAFPNILCRLWRRKPPTRGELLRRAMREAAAGQAPESLEMLRGEPGGPRGGLVLRDGTPYEQSGADEHDWRL